MLHGALDSCNGQETVVSHSAMDSSELFGGSGCYIILLYHSSRQVMTTLYISDLDGTLLDGESRVSERSAEIISALTREGALITVATARTPATVVPLLAQTLTTPPAIVMTGAAMWSRSDNRFIDAVHLTATERVTIDGVMTANGLKPFVYIREGESHLRVYHAALSLSRVEERFVDERRNLPLKNFALMTPAPTDRQAMLYYAIDDRERVFAAAEQLRSATDATVSCYPDIFNDGIGHLEVLAHGVSKAAAALRLKESMGADRIVAFGDNLNDLPMFDVADVAVAVGNAMPEVKAAADVVIGRNTEDAVARYIMHNYQCMRHNA